MIVVLGPTGSGKSHLALFLARRFHGEVVSCDSVQVYRGLDIGSAKTSRTDRLAVPHHLIDIADPDEDVTAGEYARLARPILDQVHRRGHIPFLAGGTGFYLKALLDGLSPAPERNEKLRLQLAEAARRRPGVLHRFLTLHDPLSAARIHPNDHQKLIRAIEITALAKQPASAAQRRPRESLTGWAVSKIGLAPDRQMLHAKLNRRAEEMFRDGLVAETSQLLKAGFSAKSKALQSLGYKQAVQVLAGSLPLADAILECQVKTRQYAKRQMTWFRADPEIHWLPGFGSDSDVQAAAVREVQAVASRASAIS